MEGTGVNIPALQRNKEKAEYYKNQQAEREKKALYEQAQLEKKEKEDNALYEEYLKSSEQIKDTKYEYEKFLESVRSDLLSSALCQIYGKAIEGRYFVSEDTAMYGVSLINAYIKENGSYNIIKKMKETNSLLLNNIVEAVETSYSSIVEATDKKNPETFTVSDTQMNNFYDSLDFDSFGDAADVIKCRVSTSTEEFINANKNDKDEIDELMQDTKNRIDSASSEDIAQEATRMFTIKSNKIRDERRRNVLEQLIFNMSESVIKNQSLLESYTTDDGKINFENIIEHVEIQYLVLEMMNTIKVEKFTAQKVQEMLTI